VEGVLAIAAVAIPEIPDVLGAGRVRHVLEADVQPGDHRIELRGEAVAGSTAAIVHGDPLAVIDEAGVVRSGYPPPRDQADIIGSTGEVGVIRILTVAGVP